MRLIRWIKEAWALAPWSCFSCIVDTLWATLSAYLSLWLLGQVVTALESGRFSQLLQSCSLAALALFLRALWVWLWSRFLSLEVQAANVKEQKTLLWHRCDLLTQGVSQGALLDEAHYALGHGVGLSRQGWGLICSALSRLGTVVVAWSFLRSSRLFFVAWMGLFVVVDFWGRSVGNRWGVAFNQQLASVSRKGDYLMSFFTTPSYAPALKHRPFRDFVFQKKEVFDQEYLGLYQRDHRRLRNLNFAMKVASLIEELGLWLSLAWLVAQGQLAVGAFFVSLMAWKKGRSAASSLFGVALELEALAMVARKVEAFSARLGDKRQPLASLETIRFENVDLCYGERQVIKGLSFVLQRGDKVCLTGANGSGKSTLLALAAGFLVPSDGQVLYNDRYSSTEATPHLCLALSFQEEELYPCQVGQFVTGELHPSEEKRKQIDELCREIGCSDWPVRHWKDSISALFDDQGGGASGGQAHLCCLLRALASPCEWLFLDEAEASLDQHNSEALRRWLKKCPKTVLLISHRGVPEGFRELAVGGEG